MSHSTEAQMAMPTLVTMFLFFVPHGACSAHRRHDRRTPLLRDLHGHVQDERGATGHPQQVRSKGGFGAQPNYASAQGGYGFRNPYPLFSPA